MSKLGSLSGIDRKVRRKIKRVFEKLSDEYLIREPILEEAKVASIVIEGPYNSWLFLTVHSTRPAISELEKYIDFNDALSSMDFHGIKYLSLISHAPSLFDEEVDLPQMVEIYELNDFYNQGCEIIKDNLVEVSIAQNNWIKKTLFSESVIHSQCTTRRQAISRDNSSTLQDFFLDYDQEQATKLDIIEDKSDEAIEEDFSLRLINGVAGSGKTLILINRAILLCKKYPSKEILIVIHNKPVTEDVTYRIERWLGGKPDNLSIKTFHSFALGQKNISSTRVKPLFSERDLRPLKDKILTEDNENYKNLNISDDKIWSEIEYINNYLIETEGDYLNYERQGRGFALQKTQRTDIWRLYQLSVETMSSSKGYLPSLYIREMSLMSEKNELKRFDHIFIDEAQFFEPSWLQLMRESLNSNGSIFLCADPNQGFLRSRLSWKSVGFNVRGRTKKLSYSYRTTYEIMVAANALLEFMDEGVEDFVKPDLDQMERGSKPKVIYSSTTQDEQKRFVNELKSSLSKGDVPLHQIMVLCSETYSTWNLKKYIEQEVGSNKVVNCNDSKDLAANLGERIRLMSINSCTGMESGVTFVLGIGDLLNKHKSIDLDDEEKEIVHQESIRRLYVAMTRAGQKLVLFSTDQLPDSLDHLVETTNSNG